VLRDTIFLSNNAKDEMKIFLSLLLLISSIFCTSCSHEEKGDYAFIENNGMTRMMVEQGEVRLSYVIRPGSGPTLVLIPGSFSDVSQWETMIPLLNNDLNLVLVEVRGHGKSWPPPVNGTIEQLAEDVLIVADKEKLNRFYVGGHSIGGMIAKEVGRRWPERLMGVISIEGWTHWQVSREAFNADMYSTLTPEEKKKRIELRKRGAGHWSKEQRTSFGKIWRKWERGVEFLKHTKLPVLELYGDRGREPASREQLFLAERKNIRLVWIHNASHKIPLEEPGRLAEIINEFITMVGSGTE
jgi:pimeloyl-ACP methyl ester carboxylesterase